MDVMWASMNATSPAACLYFIATVLLGTYVIINLFLSILNTGFERQGSTGDVDDLDEGTDDGDRVALQRAIDRQIARRNRLNAHHVVVTTAAQDQFRIGSGVKHLFEGGGAGSIVMESSMASMCRRCRAVKADVLSPYPGEIAYIAPDALHEHHCFAQASALPNYAFSTPSQTWENDVFVLGEAANSASRYTLFAGPTSTLEI
jgi:hypothetical protein